ncbi:MAG: HNH endonuclease [Actinomycetota bacterium]
MARRPPFSERAAREAIATSECWSDALRKLGYEPKGHNYRTLQRYAKQWGISHEHFDADIGRRRAGKRRLTPLDDILVSDSTYPRGNLKQRLFAEGIKERRCEQCGQGEKWKGRQMSLILDHINGVSNDHRFENLRILCPNCAATLDTHCGRNLPRERECAGCGKVFAPHTIHHRHCSLKCWGAVRPNSGTGGPGGGAAPGIPKPELRKVRRPIYWNLLADIEEFGYSGTGRRYDVSDNAIRKWELQYEREMDMGDFSAI